MIIMVSNVLFLVYPPLVAGLFSQYAAQVTRGVYLVWGLLLAIGLSSIYFHATLSLLGQLLDEVAILWLLMAAAALWAPRRCLPSPFSTNRRLFQRSMLVLCVVGTGLACLFPALNAFALMAFGIPGTAFMVAELLRCRNPRVLRLGVRCTVLWLCALACWINDRMFCDMWSALNFPYLHGAWHILIAIASYSACVLFAYFHVVCEFPEKLPRLLFWPSDRFELGVPYIVLKGGPNDKPIKEDAHKI
ncbi:ACER2 [Cordylochernes scorpioides]|uniref:Alkaline ceramidase n=1 Tax=Cordylochernes scorpioides TaxID=51811 RepID=A0ABY6KUZ0_9ARAC|nr:ACER2 [Cordylochernes scorpioides]